MERNPGDVRPARPSGRHESSLITTTATEHLADVTEKAGILKPGPRYSITAVSYDFDNDGWPDIYVAVDSEPSILFHNNHDGTFTDMAVMAGCAYNENGHEQAGMGVAVGDYDCDGWFDIFKTNFCRRHLQSLSQQRRRYLHRRRPSPPESASTTSTSLGAAASSITTTMAGRTSCRSTGTSIRRLRSTSIAQTFKNPRLVYKNLGDGRFKDVSAELGPGISERFSSRGAAFGDYDNDGDIDALILNMNDMPSLLRNDGGNAQNWIKVKLIGTQCNRTAIGARVARSHRHSLANG